MTLFGQIALCVIAWMMCSAVGLGFESSIRMHKGKRIHHSDVFAHLAIGPLALAGFFEWLNYRNSVEYEIDQIDRRLDLEDKKHELAMKELKNQQEQNEKLLEDMGENFEFDFDSRKLEDSEACQASSP